MNWKLLRPYYAYASIEPVKLKLMHVGIRAVSANNFAMVFTISIDSLSTKGEDVVRRNNHLIQNTCIQYTQYYYHGCTHNILANFLGSRRIRLRDFIFVKTQKQIITLRNMSVQRSYNIIQYNIFAGYHFSFGPLLPKSQRTGIRLRSTEIFVFTTIVIHVHGYLTDSCSRTTNNNKT